MDISDFDYALPPALIAQEPLPERDASRLLVLRRRADAPPLEHRGVRELPDLLTPGDLLVVNRSRVFPARLLGRREGGGAAEVLLIQAMNAGRWQALVRPGRRLRPGDVVTVAPGLRVHIETGPSLTEGRRQVWVEAAATDVAQALERAGHVPLPPYIRRPVRPADRERYQTVFARENGSVAVPTAGLHFSAALLERHAARHVERAEILLHVGPGTFLPVRTTDVAAHRMEPERFLIPEATAAAIRATRKRGGRVVAVGTTSVRALESAALDDGTVRAVSALTSLVIVPGFRFRVVDALITNFHLPRSSLLLLVAAFAGRERVLEAYAEAVRAQYRFYSYGDAMLVI